MKVNRYDLVIIGAGPAGLSAAIEGAKLGLNVVVYDENAKPGGQLFKQIHKFFGSKEHKAKVRGINIGDELLEEADKVGVNVVLNATVVGLYEEKEITVKIEDEIIHVKGDTIIVATGACENTVYFEGWTKPGVIGAGAAQTMMNQNFIQPGKKVLMLGSGNVGLVVSYQLLQAGCEVVAIVDAAPKVSGYGVHAAKVARCGVPFYLSHTIAFAEGEEAITGVTIGEVDSSWQIIEETKKHFEVDTICLAVGLSPMSQLLKMSGCKVVDDRGRGGVVPECNEFGETSISGIYACGDVSGIEEASSAMIEGRIAGIAAAFKLGYVEEETFKQLIEDNEKALDSLRQGMFAVHNRGKEIEKTDEGFDVSKHLLRKGYLSDEEVASYPGVTKKAGTHPVIECTQNIPCNPCQDVCPKGCIKVGDYITKLPAIDSEVDCTGCGLCVAHCPGQAIFLVNDDYDDEYATVTMPYEFLPLPQVGDNGYGLGRSGEVICDAIVEKVKTSKAYDFTNLLTMKVPKEYATTARFFKQIEE